MSGIHVRRLTDNEKMLLARALAVTGVAAVYAAQLLQESVRENRKRIKR